MAKSIRSKSKRANRAQLRKSFVDPIIKKRQDIMNAQLADSVERRSGKSIIGLKSMFAPRGEASAGAMDAGEESEKEEEEAVANDSQDTKKMAQKLLLKEKLKKLKSSRRQEHSKKELFEFK